VAVKYKTILAEQNRYRLVWAVILNPDQSNGLPSNEGRMCPDVYAGALISSKSVRLYQRTLSCCTLVCHIKNRNGKLVLH